MDTYRLDQQTDDGFENIIVRICNDVLGVGVTGFAKGKDGGKDARFEGVAQSYPSMASPWKGKFVVQAKHTTNSEGSCSDNSFFGNLTSEIAGEIPKIKKLKDEGEIDNYLCFTNRRLTGGKETEIRKAIISETGIDNVALLGTEYIERALTPEIIRQFNLKRHLVPFEFYEQDIRQLIITFGEKVDSITDAFDLIPMSFSREDIKEKNEKNNLSEEYFENVIESKSLQYFKQIDDFLKDARNEGLAKLYRKTAFELQPRILNEGKERPFGEVFEFIYRQIFDEENSGIVYNRNLIYVFLHFMYFQCDIGRNK